MSKQADIWEYFWFRAEHKLSEIRAGVEFGTQEELNKLGEEGWEAVGFQGDLVLLKRQRNLEVEELFSALVRAKINKVARPLPLRFEGHSDGIFGEYGRFNEDALAPERPSVWRVQASDGSGLLVWGIWGGGDPGFPADAPSCWVIGVQPLDEGVPLPDWPMRFETPDPARYSPVLVIEAPDDVTLQVVR